MKLPFTTLATVLFLLGGPIGLMQYHSRAAFIEPQAHLLLCTRPEPPLTRNSVGERLSDLMASQATTWDCSHGAVSELSSYYEAQLAKLFACLHNSQQTPGLIEATATAIAKSWTKWQPSFVALPERLVELRHRERYEVWRGKLDAYASTHHVAAGKADASLIQSLTSAIRGSTLGSVVERLSVFCDSHLPKWLANRLKPAPISGLLAATAKAIGKSVTKWQPTILVSPEHFNRLRKQDIFTIWQQRFELYALAQVEELSLASAFSLYDTDHAETIESVTIVASRTPLPATAMLALGTITSDLSIVTAGPLGRALLDAISGLHSPTFRIAKYADPALWRPALSRAIASFGPISVHNR